MPAAAQAQSVWGAGATNTTNYNLDSNWGPATSPVAAGQSAVFKNNGKVNVNVTSGPISPDSWTFNANSKSFTITGADVNFSLAGANGGIINKANSGTISISNNIGETLAGVRVQQLGAGTLVLSGVNTYSGNTTISAGTLQVTNNSSVGTGNVILDGGAFQADGVSDLKFSNRFRINAAGGEIDANGVALTLSGNIVDGAGAGPLLIRDSSLGSGRVIFTGNNTYSGDTTICACATLQLGTAANSGSMVSAVTNEGIFNIVNANALAITVTNESGSFMTFRNSSDAGTMKIDNFDGFFGGGSLEFHQTSSAADAVITNHGLTSTRFFNSSTAGNATITNASAGIGVIEFNNNSTAGSATINNAGHGFVVFNDQAKLEGGKIVNNDDGLVLFNSKSSAGNVAASITNNDHGEVHFLNQSTAGSATINNKDFGVLDFNNHSSADNATIVNSSAAVISLAFLNHSTAGNAFITTNNGSATYFFDHSDGGTARFETALGSLVDFSGSRGANNDGRINAGSIAGAGNYYIGGGNTLIAGGSDRSTEVSGVIVDNNPCGCTTGPGALEKAGLGTMILSGDNTYTGGTIITAGTLQLGNDGLTGSIVGNVVDNSILAFNHSNPFTFSGVISGSGELQQIGSSVAVLTAVESYTGLTTIASGTLALAGAGDISSSSGVVANSVFDISGLTAAGTSIQSLSGSGGTVVLGAKTLTIGSSNTDTTFDGSISGTGGLTKTGIGTLTLQNTLGGAGFSYSGITLVNAGIVRAGSLGAFSSASTFSVASGGRLELNDFNQTIGALAGDGPVRLGTASLTTGGNNASTVFSGEISGSGGLIKTGTGRFIITEANSYAGGTTISDGTLQLGTVAASTGSVVGDIVDNARLVFSKFGATSFNGVISGSGSVAIEDTPGGFTTLTNNNTYTGGTTITSGTLAIGNNGTTGSIVGNVLNNSSIIFNRSDNIGFDGLISGSGGLLKLGAGVLTLSAVNTYTGATTVEAGNLRVNGAVVGAVTVQSGATLSGIGAVGGLVTVQSGGTLSAGQSPGTLTLGALNLNAGSASVFELGSAGVVGGASNDLVSVTGNLTLGGTLSVNAPSAGYYRLFNYGTLTSSSFGAVTGSTNGTPTVLTNVPNQVNLLIAAAGQRIQFWDGADQTGNGVVNGGTGTWNAANTNWTGAPGQAGINDQWRSSVGVFAGTAGTVTIAGSQAFDTLQFSTTGYVLNAGAGGQLQLAGLSGTGTINTDNGIVATINAAIVNGSSQSLTKVGGGTLILAAANTYSGGTTISGGTLQLGNGGTTGSIAGNVIDNSIFAINRSNAFMFSGVISGAGAFQQIGAGTTTLTNTNTYTGPTTVAAGTLTVSATGSITSNVTNNATFNNAGTVTGLLNNMSAANNSGTITNGLTNTGTVNAAGIVNGAIANNAGTFTVTGVLTGDGSFTNAASATLAVGGSGAYTLQGMLSNSGAVTVASGGQLIATVGGINNNAGGTITVAAGGTVKDDLNNAGAITNNGVYLANVASNTGVITNNAVWTGTVSNAGAFNNNAGSTVSGLLANTAGITTNNGALNGGANISGGLFTGAGTVGNTTIASGAVFMPGNGAPGSFMTVTGNLAFQSGALYLVGLDPSTSSLAKVTGTATLNGGAGAAFLAGNYVAKQYTILTAAGGVGGTFSSFDTLGVPSGFKASLSYDASDVFLNLALIFAPPPGSGLNVNQQNAANAIVGFFNSYGGIASVFGGLMPAGLTQISGELATGSQQTTFDAMNLFLGLLTDPFVAGRGAGVAPPAGATPFAEESDAASAYAANGKARSKSERDAYAAIYRKAPLRDVYDPRWSVWAAGYGGSQTTDGNTVLGSNNTRSSIGGVAVGADYRFSPNTLAGFAIAGGGTSFSVNGSGSRRSDLFQAGAFVRHTVGPAYVSAALAYGWQDVTTDRVVTIAGTDLLRANFNANAYSGRVEGGYRFVAPWIGGVGITPYAAGQFTTFDLPAYVEQAIAGANTFALNYGSKSVTDTRSELGVRTDKSFAMQNGVFTLRGRAAWAHDFNPDRNIGATFQTLPGASFVVNGAAHAADSALVTGSAEMKWLSGFSLAATFEGEFSNVTRSYAGKGVARYAW